MLRYDIFYLVAALLASPVAVVRLLATGKWRTDWRARFGHVVVEGEGGDADVPDADDADPHTPAADDVPGVATRPGDVADAIDAEPPGHQGHRAAGAATAGTLADVAPPTVLVHGVSVGEVAATRKLVGRLARRARVVVSSTTDTGVERARSLHGTRHAVVRYPFDLSWMVRRFLDATRPDVVALTELEVWPNFVTECTRRDIPVCVVNGRLSASSHRGYRRVRGWVGRMFRQLAAVGAQNQTYARRFADLGVPPARIHVTDTMKWDISPQPRTGPAAEALATALGLDPARPLIVAGSTGPGEEAKLIATRPPAAQLLLVPRKPERFDAVAALHPAIHRRSARSATDGALDRAPSARRDLLLLDTMGELELAYTLADIAIIGRSFTPLGGSDPIPPVAAGCATIIGPHHENFADVVEALRAGGGITVTPSPKEAMEAATRLLRDPDARRRMARNGQRVIEEHRGASARSAELVLGLVGRESTVRMQVEEKRKPG